MKLHESQIIQNLDLFRKISIENSEEVILMRQKVDMFLLWKTLEYFQPKNILEIGVYRGQTLGLICEALTDANILGIDIDMSKVNEVIVDLGINNFSTEEINSTQFNFKNIYDFVHIDGGHSYEFVSADVINTMPHLNKNSILCLDDYPDAGVDQAIKEYLIGQNDWIPFMQGDRNTYFHHISHQADYFLDEFIQKESKNFIWFENIDYYGHTVLRAKLPHIFVENDKMFIEALKFYQL